MKLKIDNQIQNEYDQKVALSNLITGYYQSKIKEMHLQDFSRMKKYLEVFLPDTHHLMHRDIICGHLDFEPFSTPIANKQPFAVVSGLNPSSPLHLGHKVLFDLLLYLQKLGADIFIPITNDESYVDGKVASLAESRRIAYEEIIPSIIAFGFDPSKTKIYVMSDYPEVYNFAIKISRFVTNKYVETVFGNGALDNSGKAFYRSAVQLAQILLPQLAEFGGNKHTLIPVGIDQHPYLLIARDIAKKMGYVPPSEMILKFQGSLLNPFEKMSGSKPKTSIYLTDTEEMVRKKINSAYTGAVSSLDAHRILGGIPEACSVFSILHFHCTDEDFVNKIYEKYKRGLITMTELKTITADLVVKMLRDHKARISEVNNINDFLLKDHLKV